jgi:AGZA family xanthine/uracil permease-like MFS transporter
VVVSTDRSGGLFERYFRLRDHGTTTRTELLGGVTTFAAMAYVIVVNPAILRFAGLPVGPSTVATILTAAFGCLLMGLYANRPIGVAPYMGENAFIAFGLTAMGIGWQLGLGAVFVSGVAFLVVTVLRIRPWLARAVSPGMRHGIAAGIGLFLAFLGLYQSGVVTSSVEGMPTPETPFLPRPAVPVKLGNLHDPRVLLAVFGFTVTVVLRCRGVRGAILMGMALTAAAGYLVGLADSPESVAALPFTGRYDLGEIAFRMDVSGVLRVAYLPVLLTLFLMAFLDTLGTLYGVGAAGNMLDEKGDFPEVERPMLVDAATTVFAATVGTSTSGAYIESATGIRDGARTGLAAVTTGLLFTAALFFIPLVQPLQNLGYAYGPALVVVGAMMLGSARRIDWDDLTEAVPAFLTITLIAFTYNIANGLTAGLIAYPALKVLAGRRREVSPGAVVLGLMCLTYYLFGLPH